MNIKQLIGEATDYDKKLRLNQRNLKAGVRVSVHLQIAMVASWYLVWQMIMSWLDLQRLKVMQRKLVK